VSSPVREGGEPYLSIAQRPEGPAQWRTFGAQATNRRIDPALTDGATNYRSFGPKAWMRFRLNPHQTVGHSLQPNLIKRFAQSVQSLS